MTEQEYNEEYKRREQIIIESYENNKIMAGAQLHWITKHRRRISLLNNYASIWAYTKDVLGLSKNCTDTLKQVAKVFSEKDNKGEYTGIVKAGYENFSHSALREMAMMTEEQRTLVTEDMTIHAIQAIRKEKKYIPQRKTHKAVKPIIPKLNLESEFKRREKLTLAAIRAKDAPMAGAQLYWIRQNYNSLPPASDYPRFEDYADNILHIKRGTYGYYINIALKFCGTNDDGWCNGVIRTEYLKFNYSQLMAMLPLTDKQLAQVTEDMSFRDIRSINKADKPTPPRSIPEEITDEVKKLRSADQQHILAIIRYMQATSSSLMPKPPYNLPYEALSSSPRYTDPSLAVIVCPQGQTG